MEDQLPDSEVKTTHDDWYRIGTAQAWETTIGEGSQNTAADFLSRLELTPKEKVQLKLRDDIITAPIEVNLQSTDVADEEQLYFLPDEEEDSEQEIFARKTLRKQRPIHEKEQQSPYTEVTKIVQPRGRNLLRHEERIIVKDRVLASPNSEKFCSETHRRKNLKKLRSQKCQLMTKLQRKINRL